MGSVRSASTAYSSGGLFGRNRHNSVVYSSPEAGQPVMPPPPHHKMSLYERLVGRKSGRGQHRPSSRHGKSSFLVYRYVGASMGRYHNLAIKIPRYTMVTSIHQSSYAKVTKSKINHIYRHSHFYFVSI